MITARQQICIGLICHPSFPPIFQLLSGPFSHLISSHILSHQLILVPQWEQRASFDQSTMNCIKGFGGVVPPIFHVRVLNELKKLQLVEEMANSEFRRYYSCETIMQNTKIKL